MAPKKVKIGAVSAEGIVRCAECGLGVKDYTSLVHHYRKTHQTSKADMKGTELHSQHLMERIDCRKGLAITAAELDCVAVAYKDAGDIDEYKFVCKHCPAGAALSKASCATHVSKCHGVQLAVARAWLTHKDAKVIERSNGADVSHRLRLTRALAAAGALRDAPMEDSASADAGCDAPGAAAPLCPHGTDSLRAATPAAAGAAGAPRSPVAAPVRAASSSPNVRQSSEYTVAVPSVRVNEWAKSWKHPAKTNANRKKHYLRKRFGNCPIGRNQDFAMLRTMRLTSLRAGVSGLKVQEGARGGVGSR